MTFEKQGECLYSAVAQPSAAWPQRSPLASGKAKAPLFNPGFAKPDGSYVPNSADDGFNTLFYYMDNAVAAKSMTCRGTILANGVDVTADAPGRVAASTIDLIGKNGPLTVSVSVDPAKLASATKPAAASMVKVNPGKLLRQGILGFESSHAYLGDLESGTTFYPPLKPKEAGSADLRAVMTVELKGGKPSKKAGNIFPEAGAYFADNLEGSSAPRGYAGCRNRSYGNGQGVSQALPGLYYCFRTVEGHVAELKPYEVPLNSTWGFAAEYWLWE